MAQCPQCTQNIVLTIQERAKYLWCKDGVQCNNCKFSLTVSDITGLIYALGVGLFLIGGILVGLDDPEYVPKVENFVFFFAYIVWFIFWDIFWWKKIAKLTIKKTKKII